MTRWVSYCRTASTLLCALMSITQSRCWADNLNVAPSDQMVTASVQLAIADLGSARAGATIAKVADELTNEERKSLLVISEIAKRPERGASSAAAELLWILAQRGKLSDGLAAVSADLLNDDDPITRSLADWAISIRVQTQNARQSCLGGSGER